MQKVETLSPKDIREIIECVLSDLYLMVWKVIFFLIHDNILLLFITGAAAFQTIYEIVAYIINI